MGRATVKWAAAALVGAACFAPPALGADRIYWTNSAAISFTRLDGSGGADLATTGATLNGPYGVGLDPAAGRVYWVNASGNKVSFANLDGSGAGGDLNTTGATVNNPIGVAVDHLGGGSTGPTTTARRSRSPTWMGAAERTSTPAPQR